MTTSMGTVLTCISCPLGCRLEVEQDPAGGIVSVSGNECPRGEKYARDELTRPVRMVTTTVRLSGGVVAMAPVKTSAPVAKNLVDGVVGALQDICLEAPVRIGDVVVADVCGSGADIVVTRSIPAAGDA